MPEHLHRALAGELGSNGPMRFPPSAMKRRRQIRTQLNLLLLAVALPLVLLLGYAIYEDLKHDQQQAGETVIRLAENLADDVAAVTVDAGDLLERLAEHRAARLLDLAQCDAVLEELLRMDPRFHAVITTDALGNLACERHVPGASTRIRPFLADREWLHRMNAVEGLATVVADGGLLQTVQSHALRNEGGDIVGAVSVVIDVGRYAHSLDLSRYPRGTTAQIRDGTGSVVFHAPAAAGDGAGRQPGAATLASLMQEPTGRAVAVAGDGIERLYAYAAIRGTNWHVVAGIPTDAIFAPTRNLAIKNSLLALVIIGSVGFGAWWLAARISRPIHRIAQVAQAVAAGGLDQRVEVSGAAEIAEVADQFNVMIEARRRAEDLLRETHRRLQSLSRRLLDVQESERGRIARELHDEIGQALTALSLRLQTLRCRDPDRGDGAGLDECIAIADGALRQVRNLCLDLRPPQLDDLGLAAAVRWQIDRQTRAAGIAAHLMFTGIEREPAADVATVCFRVAQEAITNAVRHAGARNVWIEFDRGEKELRLVVRDDGCGFDVAARRRDALRGGSMGLLSMEERVVLEGGRFEVVSTAGGGTEVRVRLPMDTAPMSTKETVV